jgi:TonB family protein
MTARTFLAAAALALAAAPCAAQLPGYIPVARSPDGTVMFLDSASISRSGEARFVAWAVTRFSADAAAQLHGDRRVDLEELDCEARRFRGWATLLYRQDDIVARDSMATRWADVDTAFAPVFDAACGALRQSFAAALPVQLEVDEVDWQPSIRNAPAVSQALSRGYPRRLRERGTSGSAMVRVRIAEDGSVAPGDVKVVFATDPAFADAARDLAPRMRFNPAKQQGRPVAVWAMLPVEFSLLK